MKITGHFQVRLHARRGVVLRWRAEFSPDHGDDGVLLVDLSVFVLRRTLLALKMARVLVTW